MRKIRRGNALPVTSGCTQRWPCFYIFNKAIFPFFSLISSSSAIQATAGRQPPQHPPILSVQHLPHPPNAGFFLPACLSFSSLVFLSPSSCLLVSIYYPICSIFHCSFLPHDQPTSISKFCLPHQRKAET